MHKPERHEKAQKAQTILRRQLCFFVALLLPLISTGCIVVGGYSSERGWFIWPGTFVLLLIGLALFLLFRRRR
jgi:hypothetical protein